VLLGPIAFGTGEDVGSTRLRLGGEPPLPVDARVANGRLEVRSVVVGVDGNAPVLFASGIESDVRGFAVAPLMVAGRDDLLVWLDRRDENLAGVVPHDSGWMRFDPQPWINPHLMILGAQGDQVTTRWVSSAWTGTLLGLWIDPPPETTSPATLLALENARGRTWGVQYRFAGWMLEERLRVALEGPGWAHLIECLRRCPPQVDVLAVGDVMIGRGTGARLRRTGAGAAFAGILPLLREADLRVGNLESCFRRTPVSSGRLDFFAPLEHRDALRALGFDALGVANNHCSPADAAFSRRTLAGAGIATFGDPRPKAVLGEPLLLGGNGLTLALAGLTILPSDRAQLARLRRSSLAEELRQLRARADFLLLQVHWGEEYVGSPTEEQRAFGRFLTGAGVDVVLGSHPHVVQPVERVGRGVVAYSLGNFLFDQQGGTPAKDGATELGLVLHLRMHRALGVVWRERAVRILDRHRLVPAEPPF
jgi:poly-gamma-glutamate synthesis protein (capsule biosynthesis protein)